MKNLRLCFGVAQHGVERSGRFHIYKALLYHKLFFGGLIIIYIHIINFDNFSQHSGPPPEGHVTPGGVSHPYQQGIEAYTEHPGDGFACLLYYFYSCLVPVVF